MSYTARRIVYGLFTALGFAMVVPAMIRTRAVEFQLSEAIEPGTAVYGPGFSLQLTGLALLGLLIASGFLYMALSTGYPRAWRPEEGDETRCGRCGSEVPFGVQRCATCDQRFAW